MINEKELSKTCFYYEMFMERAFGRYESTIPGYHATMMRNLLVAEKGKVISMLLLNHFEKQLAAIKQQVEEALDQYMAKPGIPVGVIEKLKRSKEQLIWSISSEELMKIVFETIDITASISIKMNF